MCNMQRIHKKFWTWTRAMCRWVIGHIPLTLVQIISPVHRKGCESIPSCEIILTTLHNCGLREFILWSYTLLPPCSSEFFSEIPKCPPPPWFENCEAEMSAPGDLIPIGESVTYQCLPDHRFREFDERRTCLCNRWGEWDNLPEAGCVRE